MKQRNGNHKSSKVPQPIEDWDEYFLAIALTVSRKSKDPRCQVGAVIVSVDDLLLSTGYNGFARRVHDDKSKLQDVDEKLRWICHAEQNAILNAARAGVSTQDCTIYVTKFPCFECCKAIVQAGIKRIYTHDEKYWSDDPVDKDHSRKREILHQAGVDVRAPFHPDFRPDVPLTFQTLAEGSTTNGKAMRRKSRMRTS